jgi:nitroreductase
MNETIRLLHNRASCRAFSDKKIEPDILKSVLQAGINAPTGGNLQPYSIIKIEGEDKKKELVKLCGGQGFISKAPVNLLFCIDYHLIERWCKLEVAPFTARYSFRHFWIGFQDTIISAQNICTAADALGLGSVYIGTVLECFREIITLFKLPKGVFPVVLLCIGYPKTELKPAKKLGIDILVHDEEYQEINDDKLQKAYNEKYEGIRHRWRNITEEKLAEIEEVCKEVHGDEFARKCIDRIKEQGYINVPQNYFGLKYKANEHSKGNMEIVKIMKEAGLSPFEDSF